MGHRRRAAVLLLVGEEKKKSNTPEKMCGCCLLLLSFSPPPSLNAVSLSYCVMWSCLSKDPLLTLDIHRAHSLGISQKA